MTVTYYTSPDHYMGRTKWNFIMKYLELKNWIQSGNSIKVNGIFITNLDQYHTWACQNR